MQVAVIFDADLDAGGAIRHGTQALQLFNRNKYIISVVFTHFRFKIIANGAAPLNWIKFTAIKAVAFNRSDNDIIAGCKGADFFWRSVRFDLSAKMSDGIANNNGRGG